MRKSCRQRLVFRLSSGQTLAKFCDFIGCRIMPRDICRRSRVRQCRALPLWRAALCACGVCRPVGGLQTANRDSDVSVLQFDTLKLAFGDFPLNGPAIYTVPSCGFRDGYVLCGD